MSEMSRLQPEPGWGRSTGHVRVGRLSHSEADRAPPVPADGNDCRQAVENGLGAVESGHEEPFDQRPL